MMPVRKYAAIFSLDRINSYRTEIPTPARIKQNGASASVREDDGISILKIVGSTAGNGSRTNGMTISNALGRYFFLKSIYNPISIKNAVTGSKKPLLGTFVRKLLSPYTNSPRILVR